MMLTPLTRCSQLARLCLRVLPLASFAALAACGGKDRICRESNEPYLAARSHPPLRIPEGMTFPDRSGALEVPPAPEGAPQRPARPGDGCLADPPSYFRSAGTFARSPEEVVASWAQAWANREAEGVIALYSTRFKAPTDAADSASWLEQRREQVAVGPLPDSRIENLRIEPDGERRIATFTQRFGANAVQKELVLVREAGSWRIVQEKVLEIR